MSVTSTFFPSAVSTEMLLTLQNDFGAVYTVTLLPSAASSSTVVSPYSLPVTFEVIAYFCETTVSSADFNTGLPVVLSVSHLQYLLSSV